MDAKAKEMPALLLVGQDGRIGAEACLCVASLRQNDPDFAGRVVVAEPQPGPLWRQDPRMDAETRALLERLGAEIVPFAARHFGEDYPIGNKIEALRCLPAGGPFLYLDSDTLITGPLPTRPRGYTASLLRSDTWPRIAPDGPSRAEIWGALYDRFGLDMAPTLDPGRDDADWRRYLYFSASWVTGPCPAALAETWARIACAVRDDPPEALRDQPLTPWLDQIALPLALHALGGGRDPVAAAALDGRALCHYRALPLLYATGESGTLTALETIAGQTRVKRVLERHRPFDAMLYQGLGARTRRMARRAGPFDDEAALRRWLKRHGLWLR